MGRSILASIASIAGAFTLVVAILLSGGLAAAQDATPAIPEDDVPRPAHIHLGTCDDLGEIVFPLNDVTGAAIQGSPEASPAVPEPESPDIVQGEVVIESVTQVETTLSELLGEPHAINVHASSEDLGTYIACGNIHGEPENGRLQINLSELNESGFEGSAVLEEVEEGIQTIVAVTLRDIDEEPVNVLEGTPTPES